MSYYLNPINVGLDAVTSLGDGYTTVIRWFQAYPTVKTNSIAYHIYFSTIKENIYSEGVKYISIDDSLEVNIIDLIPGQMYYFSVRPIEYISSNYNLSDLPTAYDNLRYYPTSLLREAMTEDQLYVPLIDVEGFTDTGVVKVGVELIQYSSIFNKDLLLTSINQRGFDFTNAREHSIDGYDGYYSWNPIVTMFTAAEDLEFDRIYASQCRFEYPNFAFTIADGYKQVLVDLLHTDLTASDAANVTFPAYDYAGYHRTDPVMLFNGTCVGSYIGGEQGCIDGYGNIQILRGLSLQDQNNQRQEVLLNVDGRPVVLIKRVQTGIVCACYNASSEYQDDRCPFCYGTKFVFGYEQYFNPRRSDGRILVRSGPTEENLKMYEAGLESEYPVDLWTLTVPTIKTRDILIMFDINDNEEFRYEVMGVTRNNTLAGMQGGQKFKAMRIRKTDPAYQIRVFRNTSEFPSKLNTSIGFVPGIVPHTHTITVSEKIISISQINQTTSISQGHNHVVVAGVVMPALGHDHKIILP